jgi:hypothetical protein
MDDQTNPGGDAPEVETPATDFAEFEKAAEAQPEEDAEADGFEDADSPDEPEPADDDDDDDWQVIEHKGKQIKVPKGAAMMQADYTRKTQEIAEQRKAVEATLAQASQVSQAERQLEGQFIAVQQAIASYQNISRDEWGAWLETDPVAAQNARFELDDLRNQAMQIASQHSQVSQQRQALTQQTTAQRIAQGQRELAERIPGWGREVQAKLVEAGQTAYRFSAEELNAIDDPRIIEMLHDAYQFRAMKSAEKQRAKVTAKTSVKPVPVLKGKSGQVRPRADTNDFSSFEKMAAKILSA